MTTMGHDTLAGISPALGQRPARALLAPALAGLCLLTGAAIAAPAGISDDAPTQPLVQQTLESDGLQLDIKLSPAARDRDALRAEQSVDLELRFSYADTGEPLIGAYPAAWLDRLADENAELNQSICKRTVGKHLEGGLMSAAEVDFNEYLVLTLDTADSVSVIDPRFGFGGSRLLSRIELGAAGADWTLDPAGNWLFVAVPEKGSVAAIETATWKIQTQFRVGANPRRLGVQPDGAWLWIGHDGDAGKGPGVTVIDARGFRELMHFDTGSGPHDFTFSDDSRYAFVVNRSDNTVSVISIAGREIVATVETGRVPTSVAWSERDGMAWVAHADGTLAVVDPERGEVDAVLDVAVDHEIPALGRVLFAPGGRFAFVPVPGGDEVHIVDSARREIVRSVSVGENPVEIAFSDQLAYVTHLNSSLVFGISLTGLDDPDGKTRAIEIPIGRGATASDTRPFGTRGVVQAPGGSAMLFAHAEDRAVYYYMEGMAAPAGSFTTSRMHARAVLVLDRSLSEREPGVYVANARLGRAGPHHLSVFIDSPRWTGCIPVTINTNPDLEAKRLAARPLTVELLPGKREFVLGEPLRVEVRLRETLTEEMVEGADDAIALAVLAPGVKQRRIPLEELGDGVYALEFEPSDPGVWYLSFASASNGLGFGKSPFLTIQVVEPPEETEGSAP